MNLEIFINVKGSVTFNLLNKLKCSSKENIRTYAGTVSRNSYGLRA
jgi:hypothetical protein